MKNKNNLIIGLLIVLVLGLAGYIVYDKVFVENNDSNIKDNNKNNQEENNNSNVQDNNNQEENLNVDFTKLFKEAEELYSIFTEWTRIRIDNSQSKNFLGTDYYLVTDKKFNFKSLEEMRKKLLEYFDNPIVIKLMNTSMFKEFEGKIYRQSIFSQDIYDSANSNIKTIVINDKLVILTNDITYSRGIGPNDKTISSTGYYVVSKNESGNWIFKNFELPISLVGR